MKVLVNTRILLFLLLLCTRWSFANAQDVDLNSLSATKGFRILGAAANDNSGYAVSGLGDVNNDGVDDVIISARSADPPSKMDAGISCVIFGRNIPGGGTPFGDIQLTTGTTLLSPSVGFRILGALANDLSGTSVSGAGDVNKDGIDDIIVGAPNASPLSKTNAGIIYVIFGRDIPGGATAFTDIQLTTGASTFPASVGYRILGVASGYGFGYVVKAAGDVNHDGIGDIIIGCSAYGSSTGITYVIFGRDVQGGASAYSDIQLTTSALSPTVGFRIIGAASGDESGTVVGGAVDINGDGIDDVLVGAQGADPPSRATGGITYVIFGRNIAGGATAFGDIQLTTGVTTLAAGVGFRILGAADSDLSGSAVRAAGDINHDGIGDILVGSMYAEPGGSAPVPAGNSQVGVAYVIYGRNVSRSGAAFTDIQLPGTALPTSVGFRLYGSILSDNVGRYLNAAGDVNSDGVDDFLVGVVNGDPPSGINAGIVFVIFGRDIPNGAAAFGDIQLTSGATPLSPTFGFRILGTAANSYLGNAACSAGDVNHDGFDDLLLGAYGTTSDAGASYVLFGTPPQPTSQPTSQPSRQPSRQPSSQPSRQPTRQPSSQPTRQPIVRPSGQPSRQPSCRPSSQPSSQPTQPTSQPSSQPSRQPTSRPTTQPSRQPSCQPTLQPTMRPSRQPSAQPSCQPSLQPITGPSRQPCAQPTTQPSCQPTSHPSRQPSTQPSAQPTRQPSAQPSAQPSQQPTAQSSQQPSAQPTTQPSCQPTSRPSGQPTNEPSRQPTAQPSAQPSCQPSGQPSAQPSVQPSRQPSSQPTRQPSMQPSQQPSTQPSRQPSTQPLRLPSMRPSGQPSCQPTSMPSSHPTSQPSTKPNVRPSAQPSMQPTGQPSSHRTALPSSQPTMQPLSLPSAQPTVQPSIQPSGKPSKQPSGRPSAQPFMLPSAQPSTEPSRQPSVQPTNQPTIQPIVQPSSGPTSHPSTQPSVLPSSQPTSEPTTQPTEQLSCLPSTQPSVKPTGQPSAQPTDQPQQPSSQPTTQPTQQPCAQPSVQPTDTPSSHPSTQPSLQLSAQPSKETAIREWVTVVDNADRLTQVSYADKFVWVCGEHVQEYGIPFCAQVDADFGKERTRFPLPWGAITSVLLTGADRMTIVGKTLDDAAVSTSVASCEAVNGQLVCKSDTFQDINVDVSSYVPLAKQTVYIGSYRDEIFATIFNNDLGTFRSFIYSVLTNGMKAISITHAQSPSSYVGTFVAGTCASTASVNYIYAGVIRVDSGVMTAMYVLPSRGSILNQAGLVNAMALEEFKPDSFIAGGLQLNDGMGTNAYLLRVNSFFHAVEFGVRYIAAQQPSARSRRRASEGQGLRNRNSVVKSIVLVGSVLFMTVDVDGTYLNSQSSVCIAKVDMATGLILEQVQIESTAASLQCSNAAASTAPAAIGSDLFLYITCTAAHHNSTEQIVLSVNQDLSLSVLPPGFRRFQNDTLRAEKISFKRVFLSLSTRSASIESVEATFLVDNGIATLQPSPAPTSGPSTPPSSAPSSQPSSSSTTAPSVSPQPSSQPSTSGPTNTYKPSVKPTPRPTIAPSRAPTTKPSKLSTCAPTRRPTLIPSAKPSALPSAQATKAPSRAPSAKPTRIPTPLNTNIPTETPSQRPSIATINERRVYAASETTILSYVIGGLIALWLLYQLRKHCLYKLMKLKEDKKLMAHMKAINLPAEPRYPIFSVLVALCCTLVIEDTPELSVVEFVVEDEGARANVTQEPGGEENGSTAEVGEMTGDLAVPAAPSSLRLGAFWNSPDFDDSNDTPVVVGSGNDPGGSGIVVPGASGEAKPVNPFMTTMQEMTPTETPLAVIADTESVVSGPNSDDSSFLSDMVNALLEDTVERNNNSDDISISNEDSGSISSIGSDSDDTNTSEFNSEDGGA